MIRNATHEDVGEILRLGELFHKESRYARFPYSKDKYERVIKACIDSGIALVLDDGEISGAFIGFIAEHFFGAGKQSCDLVIYVTPDKRGKGIGLIREYKRQAIAKGVDDICISHSSGIDTERTKRLYELMGFRFIGGTYSLG